MIFAACASIGLPLVSDMPLLPRGGEDNPLWTHLLLVVYPTLPHSVGQCLAKVSHLLRIHLQKRSKKVSNNNYYSVFFYAKC